MIHKRTEQRKPWPGRITISDPVTLINEIAHRYQTMERVIMEYIDNALDDADDMARENSGKYPYPIKIQVFIDREGKKIVVFDNCRGMDFATLSRIVHKIGESKKRACPWLNGRFGFGVHAFRGFCKEIIFRTKHKSDEHYRLKFFKDSEKIRRPLTIDERFNSASGTGTVVVLQKFDEDYFEVLTAEVIKNEIEEHFETMLRKQNVTVTVSYKGERPLICQAFDYNSIHGKPFRSKDSIVYKKNKYPIEIFLKVTDIPISKKPRFFAKGRRILFIKDDKSFMNKSKYRSVVWDHSNLTGYIEVGDLVQPVITRDGFIRGKNRTQLYEAVLQYEEDLKKEIDAINKRYEDHSLSKLEDVISRALWKLSKEDALRLRTELVSGNGSISLDSGGGSEGEEGKGGPTGSGGSGGDEGGSGEGHGKGPKGSGAGTFQGTGSGGPQPQVGTGDHTGLRRRRTGVSIKFMNVPEDADGNIPRSQFNDGTININIGHPDFKDRIRRNRKGELKINQRLISYIAAVISIHYKDQYYKKYRNQPEARTQLFDQQVEFIFRLESTLLPFLRELEDAILEEYAEE